MTDISPQTLLETADVLDAMDANDWPDDIRFGMSGVLFKWDYTDSGDNDAD